MREAEASDVIGFRTGKFGNRFLDVDFGLFHSFPTFQLGMQ